jgi:PKD domain
MPRVRGPTRHLSLAVLVSLGLISVAVAPAAAVTRRPPRGPRTVDARVSAAFVMNGRIVTAVRVPGEHRGQRITRQWTFTGENCARNICRRLLLTRQRSANQVDHLVLVRTGVGRYAGNGRFYAALSCRGAIYPRGQLAPYRVTVAVTHAVTVQGISFATALTATYTNKKRTDRTICPTGPSHDAATYSGTASPGPSPPSAAFSVTVSPGTDTATFTSTSTPGGDQSPVTAFAWNFGDPASGPADGATAPQATHTFTAPGTYAVSLTVADANGLTATQSQQVVVPAPPG